MMKTALVVVAFGPGDDIDVDTAVELFRSTVRKRLGPFTTHVIDHPAAVAFVARQIESEQRRRDVQVPPEGLDV